MAEAVFVGLPKRFVSLSIDGREVEVLEGSTILDACRRLQVDTPTLCQLDNLTPVNVCRVCVVELEGSRVLVPACSRKVEAGMKIATDSERVRHSRRLVLELLASSVDMSLCSPQVHGWLARYGATPGRFGADAATVAQPVKIDNDLYVRDYSRCILCYKCVEACGVDAQNTFAIAVAGRGLDARISTEFALPLTESACVYCGNCIGVCPTGALLSKKQHDIRESRTQDQTVFITAGVAIVPLAGLIGRGTEQLALHAGPRVGGLLNATFGNVTELIIAVFLVARDEIPVVKASLTGSILGNLLLVLGLSFLAGGLRHREQSFNAQAAGVHATSLVLAVIGLFMPALFVLTTGRHDLAQREVVS